MIYALLEQANTLYWPLVIMICIDYVTGVCVAIKQRELSSEIGFAGIFRKVMIFVTAFLGKLIDQYILTTGNPTECAIILFYISNEGISILENLTHLGVPIPSFLKKTISGLSDSSTSEAADNTNDVTSATDETTNDCD